MPTTYEPIATTTLGSAAANITFSSIPSTYTDLRLVCVGTHSTGVSLRVRLNGVSGTSYSTTALNGDGSTATSTRATSSSFWNTSIGASLSTTIPSMITLDIFSYAGSTFKTGLSTASQDYNGSGVVTRAVHLFRDTTAVSSILINTFDTLSAGFTATLYGIKNA